jgi:hypothetical protein
MPMPLRLATVLLLVLPALLGAEERRPINTDHLDKPTRLLAARRHIDVDIGHAAPFVTDWDGDGRKDLLVGQYGEGLLRLYRNVGERAAPEFGKHEYVVAGGEQARVPVG